METGSIKMSLSTNTQAECNTPSLNHVNPYVRPKSQAEPYPKLNANLSYNSSDTSDNTPRLLRTDPFSQDRTAQVCATLNSIKKIRDKLDLNDSVTADLNIVSNDIPRYKKVNVKKAVSKSRQTKLSKCINLTDNDWIGLIPDYPENNASRFWIQNVQSIDIKDNFLHFRSLLKSFRSRHVEFIGLTETRLSPYNAYVNENIQASYKLEFPEGSLSSTNTFISKNSNTTRQYGGVLSAVSGTMSSRYIRTEKEKYGRFHYSDFYGKDHYLRVYTVYRVCCNTESQAGDNTAWTDQKTVLQKEDEKEMDPRKNVTLTLIRMLKDDIKCKRQVILVGDMNEDVLSDKGLNKQLTSIGLVNMIKERLPVLETVRTYDRGSKIIDGLWATPIVSDYITHVSLAPFYTEVISDHRPLVFDLNLKQFLDAKDIDIRPPCGRRLKFNSPKRVDAYVKYVQKQWEDHNISYRLSQIRHYSSDKGVDSFFVDALTKLDNQIQEILSAGEKNCCKIPANASFQWSVKLEKALQRIRSAKLKLRHLGDIGDHGCGANYKRELKPVLDELKLARQDLRSVKQKDIDLRKAHLEERAERMVEENPKAEKVHILKQLNRIEEQIRDAKRVRFALKGLEQAGVSIIYIPALSEYSDQEKSRPLFDHKNIDIIWNKIDTPDWRKIKNWEKIEQQDEIESMTTAFMRKHLAQAQGTPLTTDAWDEKLQCEEIQKQILNGTFVPPPETPQAVIDYIYHLQRPNTIEHDIDFDYTEEDFRQFIQNADERTSSSPSSRHYGHWKTIEKYCPEIFSDLFKILSLVMKNCVMLPRLLRTVMTLLKKEDVPYIHRLRPILLVEIEIQAISSSQWAKKFSQASEKHHIITESQYGGRKGRQAQSAVLNKILYYDINNQYVQDYTIVDEDLKANYDRELSTLAGIEARKTGGSFMASKFMVDFITRQKFHVKTKYGISNTHFCNLPNDKIWGLGQGLAWSGESWKASSSTIDSCMKKRCTGMKLSSPDQMMEVNKIMDLYIDDSAQCCNNTSEGRSLLQQTEHNLQYHAHLVYATGGVLALDKCKYYDIRHSFVNGKPRFLRKNEFDSVLEIQSDFNSPKSIIKLLNFDQAHKTLGYFVCPSGNQQETVKQLSNLARKWVNRVQQSTLRDYEILLAYESVLLRQWAYRLPGSRLTYDECNKIMKIVEPTLLHAMHSQKNLSRTLLQAGDTYAGMGFRHLYDLAAEEKFKFLKMHIKRNDTTGKLLRISMQVSQLQSGCEKPFYNLSYESYSHLVTPTWFTSLWEYMDSRLINLDLALEIGFRRQRTNDKFIMDVLHDKFSHDDLDKINRTRISLKLLTLADVTDVKGIKFLHEIKSGINHRESKMKWPRQPLLRSWLPLWQQACSHLQREISKKPLGTWICTHQIWKWKASRDGRFLKSNTSVYIRTNVRHGIRYFTTDEVSNNVELFPADIRLCKGRPLLISCDVVPTMRQVNNFCPTKYEEVFPDLQCTDEESERINDSILNNNVIIATDGSVTNKMGGGAFCLSTLEGEILFQYNFPVPGEYDDVHSTRTEMFAILAALIFLKKIHAKYKHCDKPKIVLVSDSMNAIKAAYEKIFVSISNVFENDGDIKSELRWQRQISKYNIIMEHVCAHQGDDVDINDLPLHQRLNRLMDSHAKAVFDDYSHKFFQSTIPPFLAAQKISLRTPYNRFVYDVKNKLNEYKLGHDTEALLSKNWKIKQNHLSLISWNTLWCVSRSMKKKNRYRTVKTVHNQWHTMSRAFKWQQTHSDLCPLCNLYPEDTDHVLKCSAQEAKSARTKQLLELRELLDKLETNNLLRNRMMSVILQWTNGFDCGEYQLDENLEIELVNAAFRSQQHIGIRNLFRGLIANDIVFLQKEHYVKNTHKKHNTIESWCKKVGTKLVTISIELWKNRCEIVHETESGTIEKNTRNNAYDLLLKMKRAPWSLPSASRHLLEREQDFFRTAAFHDVSGWLRRIQYGIQEMETSEKRGSTDIRIWALKSMSTNMSNAGSTKKSTITYKKKFNVSTTKQLRLSVIRSTRKKSCCIANFLKNEIEAYGNDHGTVFLTLIEYFDDDFDESFLHILKNIILTIFDVMN